MQPSRANSAKHKQHKENQDPKSGQFDSESIDGYHSNSGRNHDQDSMRSRPNSSQSRGNLVKSQSDGGWSRTSRSRPSSGSDRHTSASRRNSQTSYEGNLPNNSPSKSSSVGKEGQRPKSVHYEYSEVIIVACPLLGMNLYCVVKRLLDLLLCHISLGVYLCVNFLSHLCLCFFIESVKYLSGIACSNYVIVHEILHIFFSVRFIFY